MDRLPRDFKVTQIYEWENEPAPERPSEFGTSTGFSMSGYSTVTPIEPRPRTRPAGNGLITLLCVSGVLGGGVLGLLAMIHMLRG